MNFIKILSIILLSVMSFSSILGGISLLLTPDKIGDGIFSILFGIVLIVAIIKIRKIKIQDSRAKSQTKKPLITKNAGRIGYFNLSNWWNDSFTEEERNYINSKFTSTNINTMETKKVFLDRGIFDGSGIRTQMGEYNSVMFLSQSGAYFLKKEDRHIARRFFDKAVSLIKPDMHPVMLHFLYTNMIDTEVYDDETRKSYIFKMLELEPAVRKDFKKDGFMPGHIGYETLIQILYKEGNRQDAIKYCKEAKRRGWEGNWDKLEEKAKCKLNNENITLKKEYMNIMKNYLSIQKRI